jgi:O-antigen/teichoic acid export membrane protein
LNSVSEQQSAPALGLKLAATNSLWHVGRMAADKVLNLVLIMLLARWLGPSDFGLLGAAAAYAGLFGAVSGASWHPLLVQEMVRRPKDAPVIIGSAIYCLLGLSLAAALLAASVLVLPWSKPGQGFIVLVLCHLPLLVLNSPGMCLAAWFQSRLQDKKHLPYGILVNLIRVSGKLGIAWAGGPLWGLAGVEPLAAGIRTLWLGRIWKRSVGEKFRLSWQSAQAGSLWKQGWPLLIWGSMSLIYQSIDQVMLAAMQGTQSTGIYLASVRLSRAWITLPALILPSMLPYLTQLKARDHALHLVRTKQLTFALTWLAILIASGTSIFAEPLVQFMYGPQYKESVPILLVVIWGNVFSFQALVRGQWILLEGLQRTAWMFPLMGALSNVAANYFLIPRWGAMGAAWTTLVSQVIAVVLTPLLFKPTRNSSLMLLRALVPWWPANPGTNKP